MNNSTIYDQSSTTTIPSSFMMSSSQLQPPLPPQASQLQQSLSSQPSAAAAAASAAASASAEATPTVSNAIRDFNNKMVEWKHWTFISFSVWYSVLIYIQMILLSKNITSVFRQVPASFGEMFTRLTIHHYIYMASIIISQPLMLRYLFTLSTNSFSLQKVIMENCLESNPFYYCFLLSSFAIVSTMLYRTYSNFEYVFSFPKIQTPLMLQTKSSIYSCFWNAFYSSFYLFVSLLFYGSIILILFKTFPLRIVSFASKFWIFAMVLLFQYQLRQRLYEVFVSKNMRFITDKFTTITVNNPNIFLLFGIISDDPLVKHHAWRDLLYVSQHQDERRKSLYSDLKNSLGDQPTIINILQEYQSIMTQLVTKLQVPPEYYVEQQQKQQQLQQAMLLEQSPLFQQFVKLVQKATGITMDFNVYECEVRQCLSNTQHIVWAIEALSQFILLSFPVVHHHGVSNSIDRETKDNATYIHKFQIIQKFLEPLLDLVMTLDSIEAQHQSTTVLSESSVIEDPYFIKRILNQEELFPTCLGVLPTVRPHFRLLKYVSKNIITQMLDRVGYQLSDTSFQYKYKSILKQFRSGEVFIYTKIIK
ncbi:hypothetical protein DFA_03068 [Cavenderia fasciculata]|uniref:Uncharacterized protein n=1 Tax=Cavenderia fasciculata TaxID=261658 RepID=F4PGI9_CACFS|nr:uncharacterized protein DFA_03068 [Cavenderia fasciculata]EGG24823.1 hypothetical protein DFA_03068 [Cavenderia fasciculata]|eukprot:XP_004362674.1 hypothetical protein DFA_03068 [Cavenderia fasciculata]